MPIGGTIIARVVPWARCCENPNKNTRTGTITIPPPIPINPLITPATNPKSRYGPIVAIRHALLSGSPSMNGHLRRCRFGIPPHVPTAYAPGGFLAPPGIWRIPERAQLAEDSDRLLGSPQDPS